jgi:hypothetical protein
MCDGEDGMRPNVIGCSSVGGLVCREYEVGPRRLAVTRTGDAVWYVYHNERCIKNKLKIYAVDRAVRTRPWVLRGLLGLVRFTDVAEDSTLQA